MDLAMKKIKKCWIITALACLAVGASAAVVTWTGEGTGSSWATDANWDTGVAPAGVDDFAYISSSAVIAGRGYPVLSTDAGTLKALYIGPAGGDSTVATLDIAESGELITSAAFGVLIGWHTDGMVTSAGSVNTGAGRTLLGYNGNGGSGTLHLTGGSWITDYIDWDTATTNHIQLDAGLLITTKTGNGLGALVQANQTLDITGGTLVLAGDQTDNVDYWSANNSLTGYGYGANLRKELIDGYTYVTAIPVLYVDDYFSFQDCYDALPSTGGTMILSENTTYTMTSTLNVYKPNVTIRGLDWSSVVERANSFNGCLIDFYGEGGRVQSCTINGNGVNNHGSGPDLRMQGDYAICDSVQVTNSGRIALSFQSEGGLVTNCYIRGLGDLGYGSYGIWALANKSVEIIGNLVENTFIDGIALNGFNSVAEYNIVAGCHHDASIGGGQIVVYTGSSGVRVQFNEVYKGGSELAGGIELNGIDISAYQNNIYDMNFFGIAINANSSDIRVNANLVQNYGQEIPTASAFIAADGVTNITLIANTFKDNDFQGKQKCGIRFVGNNDILEVRYNVLTENAYPLLISNNCGVDMIIDNNAGVDNVRPEIITASSVILPVNPTCALIGTGIINAIPSLMWQGRIVEIYSANQISFVQSSTVENSFTAASNTFFYATCNGQKWLLSSQ